MEAHLFEEMARTEDHHWWFRGRRNIIEAVLRQHLPPASQRRILDVGCGTGGNLPLLQRFGQVVGLEGSPDALALCRRRLGLDFPLHQGHIPQDIPPGRFDVVTAFDVLEHIPDAEGALRGIRSALAPGGLLVLTVPAFGFLWSEHDTVHHHQRRYTVDLLTAQLTGAGLRPRWSSYFNSLLFPPIAVVRLLQRLLPRPRNGAPRSDVEVTDGSGLTNQVLEAVFSAERHVVPRVSLPFGVSLIAVASAEAGN
ncbi:class I SAM-dependent methyltransferase [Archangium violaceum]|uniref:class I SAM-dependent methyltransferase n=1 Tax=Archangium violaceum TaxID=83451 RepID=UPI00193B0353|nr:class I SAM-dependent methyltransferase [Archangium violaceum]QRK08173.1 class I SAM-dependent methyltransferase [Archangium violaceum]